MEIVMKILIYPDSKSSSNFYLENLYRILSIKFQVDGYYRIKSDGIKKILSYDCYSLNWFESIFRKRFKWIFFTSRFFFLFLLKILNKKIIWTIHNKIPHEPNFYSRILIFLLKRWSSKIHILCSATVIECKLQKYEKKIVCVSHGDYFNNYLRSDFNVKEHYSIPQENNILLFVGQIRSYKNINLLIGAFEKSKLSKGNWTLLICGEGKLNIQSSKNIILDFNFIPNEKIRAYLEQSSILIAPYNRKSALNSGTLWLACSFAKPFILPNIGCVKDISNREEFLYVYDYANQKEHLNNLTDTLNKVNPDVLEAMGTNAYKFILENSWEKNKEKWWGIFE
jgi:glycosyltransferase involved in cell wall biosynthesis